MNSYFTIYDFMVDELHLSQNQLLVYALIFSFTVNSQSGCSGSKSAIARRIGACRMTVNKSLHALMQKGFIEEKSAGKTKIYLLKSFTGSDKFFSSDMIKSLSETCQISLHNNKSDNKNDRYSKKRRAPQKSQPSFDLNKAEEFSY